jgi:LacI family transcriptional regulator
MRPGQIGQIAEVSQGPRVTLADVAARAGVHPATASRALSPDRQPMIGPGTVQRVVQAAADLAYEPDLVARALRTQRSFTVGVLMPGPEDPSVLPLLRGVEDGLAAAGYATLLAGPGGADREAAVARMRARHVDGLIIPGAVLASTACASAPPDAWPPGLPVVVAGRPPAPARVPAAAVDHAHGARLVLDHLTGLGHRRIGRITLPAGGASPSHRPGVRDLAARAGTAQEGQRCAHALLAQGCTAIAAATDLLAAGVLAAVAQAGQRCPADITVTGYGDTPLSTALAPPLTTVRLPYFQVGRLAAELLLAAISGQPAPAEIRYAAPELVVRASCAPGPGYDRHTHT